MQKHDIVVITTAVKLSASQKKQVRSQLEKKLGPSFIYQEMVDPSVVGGIKISIAGQELDATVAGQIEGLESHLLQVTVRTAVPLTNQQRKRIKINLDEKYGSVEYREFVDPNLVGGIKLTVGSEEYDGTLRTMLDRLQVHITKQL